MSAHGNPRKMLILPEETGNISMCVCLFYKNFVKVMPNAFFGIYYYWICI